MDRGSLGREFCTRRLFIPLIHTESYRKSIGEQAGKVSYLLLCELKKKFSVEVLRMEALCTLVFLVFCCCGDNHSLRRQNE